MLGTAAMLPRSSPGMTRIARWYFRPKSQSRGPFMATPSSSSGLTGFLPRGNRTASRLWRSWTRETTLSLCFTWWGAVPGVEWIWMRQMPTSSRSERAGSPLAELQRAGRGPRSRGAVGVGDVAGERGDRAADVWSRMTSLPDIDPGWSSSSTRRSSGMTLPRVAGRGCGTRGARPSTAMSRTTSMLGAESRVEIEDISAVGDRVLAHIRYVGRGHQSGMELERHVVTAVYDLRAGRVLRVRQFVDEPKPSKPWGCRSRRCRERTWSPPSVG